MPLAGRPPSDGGDDGTLRVWRSHGPGQALAGQIVAVRHPGPGPFSAHGEARGGDPLDDRRGPMAASPWLEGPSAPHRRATCDHPKGKIRARFSGGMVVRVTCRFLSGLGLLGLGVLVVLLMAAPVSADHGGTGVVVATDNAGDAAGGQPARDWVRLGASSDSTYLYLYIKVDSVGVPPTPTGSQITYEVSWCHNDVLYFISPDWLTTGGWGGSNVYTAGSCDAAAAGAGPTPVPRPRWVCNELQVLVPLSGFTVRPVAGDVLGQLALVTWNGGTPQQTFDGGQRGSHTIGTSGNVEQPAPAAPSVAVTGDNEVTVTWTSVDIDALPVTQYHVYREDGGSGGYTKVGTVPVAASLGSGQPVAFVDTTAPIETSQNATTVPQSHRYKVVSENCQGESDKSDASPAIAPDFRPQAPTGLSASAVNEFDITLDWNAPDDCPALSCTPAGTGASGIAQYELYRSTDSTVDETDVLVCTCPGSTLSVEDTGLADDTTYHYAMRASDGYAGSDGPNVGPFSTVLTVTTPEYIEPNDVPVTIDKALETDEDTPLTFTVSSAWATDTEDDFADLDFQITFLPSGLEGSKPTFTYEPPDDFCTPDDAPLAGVFTVTDTRGQSTQGAFTIKVHCVNDPPVVVLGEDVKVWEDLIRYEAPWASLDAIEAGQSFDKITLTPEDPSLFASGPDLTEDGTLLFKPALNAFGSTKVAVEVVDSGGKANGGQDTWPGTFNITIKPVNDAPRFVPAQTTVQMVEDDPPYEALWARSISVGPPNEADQSYEFKVVVDDPSLFNGEAGRPQVDDESGILAFELARDAFGDALVVVTLKDSGGLPGVDEFSRELSIKIEGVNDAPVAEDDGFDVFMDVQEWPLDVLANDKDVDGVVSLVEGGFTQPDEGIVAWDGERFLYTPPSGFSDRTEFTYSVQDAEGLTDTATVVLDVDSPSNPLALVMGPSEACMGEPQEFVVQGHYRGHVATDFTVDMGGDDADEVSGDLAYERVVSHAFDEKGERLVEVTVLFDDGESASAELVHRVLGCVAPTGTFEVDQNDRRVDFRASVVDEDGEVVSVVWDLAGVPDSGWEVGREFGHGSHGITMTATDDEGNVLVVKKVVVVVPPAGVAAGGPLSVDEVVVEDEAEAAGVQVEVPESAGPVARVSAPDVVRSGVVLLDGSASSAPDGRELSFAWRQVRGPAVELTGAEAEVASFEAVAAGVYGFRLEVHDGVASDETVVEVRVDPKDAGFRVAVEDGVHFFEPLDVDGVFRWDFGDGTSSVERQPSHRYEPGSYEVRLEVTLPDGTLVERVQTVNVAAGETVPDEQASDRDDRPSKVDAVPVVAAQAAVGPLGLGLLISGVALFVVLLGVLIAMRPRR